MARKIPPVTALSRLIEGRVKERGLSNRDIARLSEKCPSAIGTISAAAAALYRSGKHPEIPSDRLLRVLSWVLEIPMQELQHAAGIKESLGQWVPPPEAHRMTRRQRAVIGEVIKLLVASSENSGDDENVTYEGTRHIMEEAPAPTEPSAEERAMPRPAESRENGSAST